MAGERIAKIMARAGLCSRRDAERWIAEGRVAVNGTVLASPAVTVTDEDEIAVDGKALPKADKTRLFLYHKPEGVLTTARDERGRPTVYDKFPPSLPRVVTVGRLDMNTEGLLLLTNDGALARYMELPETGLRREYRVRVHGRVDSDRLAALANGITVDGVRYGAIAARVDKEQGANCWLTVTLAEGKNREIRRVMEALGLNVNRLIRLSYGSFHLGKLPREAILEVPYKKLQEHLPGYFGKKGG